MKYYPCLLHFVAYELFPVIRSILLFCWFTFKQIKESSSSLIVSPLPFQFILKHYYTMKGTPGTVVKLLHCDHEVMGWSPRNSLLQKCRERLRKKNSACSGVRPPLLRNRRPSHAGKEYLQTPLPPLHKGHIVPCECWAGAMHRYRCYAPLPLLCTVTAAGLALTCALECGETRGFF
jgi:hypothetical protein